MGWRHMEVEVLEVQIVIILHHLKSYLLEAPVEEYPLHYPLQQRAIIKNQHQNKHRANMNKISTRIITTSIIISNKNIQNLLLPQDQLFIRKEIHHHQIKSQLITLHIKHRRKAIIKRWWWINMEHTKSMFYRIHHQFRTRKQLVSHQPRRSTKSH